jgi:hypothetical protein
MKAIYETVGKVWKNNNIMQAKQLPVLLLYHVSFLRRQSTTHTPVSLRDANLRVLAYLVFFLSLDTDPLHAVPLATWLSKHDAPHEYARNQLVQHTQLVPRVEVAAKQTNNGSRTSSDTKSRSKLLFLLNDLHAAPASRSGRLPFSPQVEKWFPLRHLERFSTYKTRTTLKA